MISYIMIYICPDRCGPVPLFTRGMLTVDSERPSSYTRQHVYSGVSGVDTYSFPVYVARLRQATEQL